MGKIHKEYFRNLIFGAEDALVSTSGVVFGLATNSGYSSKQLIITGLVVISVEALSMAAGAFLTEESVHEIDAQNANEAEKDNTVLDATVMFFAYAIAGILVLLPYLFFDSGNAKYFSMGITLVALFLLGLLPAKKLKDGIRMVVVAGVAIAIGTLVANFA